MRQVHRSEIHSVTRIRAGGVTVIMVAIMCVAFETVAQLCSSAARRDLLTRCSQTTTIAGLDDSDGYPYHRLSLLWLRLHCYLVSRLSPLPSLPCTSETRPPAIPVAMVVSHSRTPGRTHARTPPAVQRRKAVTATTPNDENRSVQQTSVASAGARTKAPLTEQVLNSSPGRTPKLRNPPKAPKVERSDGLRHMGEADVRS